jgi:large subunit ribosomal protein L6
MSKIGRKPITFSSAKIEIDGNKILISGAKAKFVHELSDNLNVSLQDKSLLLSLKVDSRIARMEWGLHRALLANKVKGVESGFERLVKIVGLGYKAQKSGKKLTLSLGYSHKVSYTMPEGVDVDIDKSGQKLLFKSHDKSLLGRVCDEVRRFRVPEPYKGTGIMRDDEVIVRKAGKTGA